jgi:hypothetical protein
VASVAERYLLLGLRLGKHVDGLVDGYYGPPELKETVDAEEPADPEALGEEARALSHAAEEEEDAQRRRWLTAQLRGLECVAEMIGGVDVSWLEAVRRCYGLEIEVAAEERFAEAHERFEEVLPGDGDLAERLQAWNRAQELPAEMVLPLTQAFLAELRESTRALVDLPEGEQLDVEIVTGQPWGAYNWYLGGLRSRIDINTDLPTRAHFLAMGTAHEAYPGHHTEHACKEALLVRARGRTEASILLIHTPECLASEGIAQIAIEQAFGEDWHERVASIYSRFDVAFDAEQTRAVLDSYRLLDDVSVNAAYFVAERGWSKDDAVAYLQRWNLAEEERARKSVEFLTHPVWSIYVPTYSYGHRLARSYADSSPDAFRRMLTEQLTTADLLETPAPAGA